MDSTIIVTNHSNKKNILKSLSCEKRLSQYKFFTFSELKKKLFFDYDNRAIEYIMAKYSVPYDIACIYLEHLYFLKDLDDTKIVFLNQLKKELNEHELLIYHPTFKQYLKNKRIILWDILRLTKEQELILKDYLDQLEFRKLENASFQPNVYEANTMKEEVEFLLQQISELIYHGKSFQQIKIIASKEYYSLLDYYFGIYQIPVHMPCENSFYSTLVAQEFLKNYDTLSIEENIQSLLLKYEVINDLIAIVNRSVLVNDKKLRKEFIIHDMKHEKLHGKKYHQAIEVCSISDSFSSDDTVFLLGFNINYYPKIHKNDDYFNDRIRESLGLDTSIQQNAYEKEFLSMKLQSIPNLIITYKLNDGKTKYYPSILITSLNLSVNKIKLNPNITYSSLYSMLKYAEDLDTLYQFNHINDTLSLYQNSFHIPYLEFNHSFQGISKNLLNKRLKGELTLSYTTLEQYNECAFKYYVSRILKIDEFTQNFKMFLGTIAHHILEIGLLEDISIEREIMAFVKEQDYQLNAKEFFYLEKLSKELEDVLSIMKEQNSHSKFSNFILEKDLYVYKDRDDIKITFKGLIDKVMIADSEFGKIIAVVDYKTGSKKITLETVPYGINMQLPLYLYLLKKSDAFQDAIIGGFYIQQILPGISNVSDKSLFEMKKDGLKLQGYSNSSVSVLEKIDDTYLNSEVIRGLKFKKDGTINSKAKVLTEVEMEDLTEVCDHKIDECVHHILSGDFSIHPKVYQQENIACSTCTFKDICFTTKEDEEVIGGRDNELYSRTTTSD